MGEVVGQLLIAGLTSGSIYGIVALAFTMIYNSTQIVNFAQGDFVVVGAMFSFFFITKLMLPQIVAFMLILVVLALVGLAMNWLIVKPLQAKGQRFSTSSLPHWPMESSWPKAMPFFSENSNMQYLRRLGETPSDSGLSASGLRTWRSSWSRGFSSYFYGYC